MKPRMRLFFHTTRVLKIRQTLWYSALWTPPARLSVSGHKSRTGSQAQWGGSLAGQSAEARGRIKRASGERGELPRPPPLMDSTQGLPLCGSR